MFKVKIWIYTKYTNGTDLEEIEITSEKSLQSAKNRATRWLKKEYFASDLEEIKKEQVSEFSKRADWTITFTA